MTAYTETDLSYRAGNRDMRGRLFMPATPAPGRAVLVFPEAPGPGEHVLGRGARLAGAGIPALVCDLHGDGLVLGQMDEIFARLGDLRSNPQEVLTRGEAAMAALRGVPGLATAKIAAIGYCFGGTMALELGRSGAAIAGIVAFHAGLQPLSDRRGLACPVLACTGDDDPSVLVAERQAFEAELRTAGVEWTLQVYGGVVHAFTDPNIARIGRPEFARYDAWADAQSWDAMSGFFDHIF